jgi:hypothetical protein
MTIRTLFLSFGLVAMIPLKGINILDAIEQSDVERTRELLVQQGALPAKRRHELIQIAQGIVEESKKKTQGLMHSSTDLFYVVGGSLLTLLALKYTLPGIAQAHSGRNLLFVLLIGGGTGCAGAYAAYKGWNLHDAHGRVEKAQLIKRLLEDAVHKK